MMNWNLYKASNQKLETFYTHKSSDVILEVIGKTFVKPSVAPPMAGHEVTEPHVRSLVGHNLGDPIFEVWCRYFRNIQQ